MTTTTRRIEQAQTVAAEYARLVAAGRYPEADQASRTIDELVGRRTAQGFVWPTRVAQIAGVSRIR